MSSEDRLRPHPESRLAGTTQVVDLEGAVRMLRAEAHPAVAGHRQITVFRNGPVTLVVFVFATAGYLNEHKANGVVTIQVLAGQLAVDVADQTHELGAGQLVALGPGVPHTVRALSPSEMLLTVHRSEREGGYSTLSA